MSASRRATFQIPTDDGDELQPVPEHVMVDVERVARRVVGDRRSHRHTSLSRPPIDLGEGESFYPQSPQIQQSGMLTIHRPVYSQSDFQKCFEEKTEETDLHKHFKDTVFIPSSLSLPNCKRTLSSLFPIVGVLRHYRWRRDLGLDIISGITTGVMRIPQSMAYAFLANLSPGMGLYTAFFSALFYTIFGGANHLVTGAQGVLSLMLGSGIERYMHEHSFNVTEGNRTHDITAEAARVALPITLMAGVFQIALGVFRLGFITNYLSDPLVGGFTSGAAVQVIVSLLKDVLGVKEMTASGWYKVPVTLYRVCANIQKTNVATLTISLMSILLLSLFKFVNHKCKPRYPLPGELFVMTAIILFSSFTHADKRWKVKVVGHVPAGFQPPELPDPQIIPDVIDVSFTSAIVSFAIGYSIAKRLALKHDYEISGNQEVFAFGVMNCASSFFHGFVATSSMSVSALHDSLGGVSQLANVVAAGIVLSVILFLGFVFRAAPDCLLSAIILVNLKSILMQFGDLKVLWRVSKIDFLLWIVTWTAVVILDVDIGLLIGVALSLLTIVFRTQWPYVCELGRIPSTDLYKNRSITPEALTIEGVRIFRFEGSLYFASAEHFRRSLYKQPDCNPYKIVRGRQTFASKIQELRTTLLNMENAQQHLEAEAPDENTRLIQAAAVQPRKEIHHLIMDFSTCAFIDSVGLRTLNQCIAEYREAGISVYLANVRAAVRTILFNDASRSGVSSRKTFLSVHDAVLAALEAAQRQQERDDLMMDAMTSSIYRHNVSRMSSVSFRNPEREEV